MLQRQKKLRARSQKWVASQWERWIQLDQHLRPCQSPGWAEQQTGAVRRGVGKSMDSIFSQAGWPREIVSKKIVENDMFETSNSVFNISDKAKFPIKVSETIIWVLWILPISTHCQMSSCVTKPSSSSHLTTWRMSCWSAGWVVNLKRRKSSCLF